MEAYKIGFIIEQALGHVTHGKNLQVNVPKDKSVEAHWGLPAFETSKKDSEESSKSYQHR